MPMIPRTAILNSLLLIVAVQLAIADGVPPKVTGVSVSKAMKEGKPTLRLTWTALQNVPNLLEYRVEYRRNGEFNWDFGVSAQPYSTSTLLPELLPGTEYNVRMRAVSVAGEGEWSEVLTETTFDRPKVTNVSVTKAVEDGTFTLTVSWTAPKSELPITEYEMEYRTSDMESWIKSTRLSVSPPANSTVLTGLDAGVEYIIRVRAVSEIGAGAWSEEQRVRTDDIPPKVTGVSVSKDAINGQPTLRVTWTALQNVKNLSEYRVEYRRNGTLSWEDNRVSAQPYTTSTPLPALLPGIEYNVRMRAVSAAGEGEWSEVLTETTHNVPPKVTGVSVSKAVKDGQPSLRVNWTDLQNGANPSKYHVQYGKTREFSWGNQVITHATTIFLSKLCHGTEYNVRVRAVSTAVNGEWSEVLTETTFYKPKVTNVSVTQSLEDGNVTLNVSWTTRKSELSISEYEVEYRTSDTESWINSTRLSVSPPANSTVLTGLDAGVEYIIRVRALSEIGAGVWSEEQRVRTDDTKVGSCNRFGNCWQPDKTTAVIVGAIIAVGVVLLVLLIVGAVPLVVCLMRRQKRIKREIIDDYACAQGRDDNAVPTDLDYYDTPERFKMQFPELVSHHDQEEALYWEPATSLHGIQAQMNQKAKDSFELDPASITLQESLGEGEFGTVYKGVWASSPQGPLQVAVKSLHSQEKDNKYKLLKEAAIMGQFSHPNVVRLYGVIDKPGKVMLIMEYLSRGDLRNHLMNYRSHTAYKTLSLTLLRFCQEIADAMDYLSKKGFIHRDLAARNILLSEQYIAKIADFGMSHDLDEDHYYKSKGGMIPVKWTAPESVLYKKYTTKSDVWSYGMVMYEIWSLGHKPFEEFEINSVLRAFKTGYCQPPPPGCPRNIYKLLVDCWNPEHHERPTFEDITMGLARDPVVLLSWSQQDKETSSKAAVLAAPLEEGKHLYPDLQNKYM